MFGIRYAKLTRRVFVEIFGIVIKFQLPARNNNPDLLAANLFYELADPRTLASVKLPVMANRDETLDTLVKTGKSIARYGDGEFKLMSGENICFQTYNPVLEERLKQILKNQDENILVAVGDMFGAVPEPVKYHRQLMVDLRDMLYENMDLSKTYYQTHFVRQFYFGTKSEGVKYYNKIKKLWSKKDVVLVEGEGSYFGTGNDLLAGASFVERIVCPMKNAFSKYDEILAQCLKQPKSKVFVMALGPTATVLAYDLAKAGYRALDVGHLDIAYEVFLRLHGRAKSFLPIEGKIVFNGDRKKGKIKECRDKKYYEQLVAKII